MDRTLFEVCLIIACSGHYCLLSLKRHLTRTLFEKDQQMGDIQKKSMDFTSRVQRCLIMKPRDIIQQIESISLVVQFEWPIK